MCTSVFEMQFWLEKFDLHLDCAWDSNQGPQNCRSRQIQWAMATARFIENLFCERLLFVLPLQWRHQLLSIVSLYFLKNVPTKWQGMNVCFLEGSFTVQLTSHFTCLDSTKQVNLLIILMHMIKLLNPKWPKQDVRLMYSDTSP